MYNDCQGQQLGVREALGCMKLLLCATLSQKGGGVRKFRKVEEGKLLTVYLATSRV